MVGTRRRRGLPRPGAGAPRPPRGGRDGVPQGDARGSAPRRSTGPWPRPIPRPASPSRTTRGLPNARIALPEPPAELRPWRPGIADIDDWRDTPSYAPVGAGTLVMAVDPEPQDAAGILARRRARRGSPARGACSKRDTRFEGYAWYDALARVTDLRIEVTEGGRDATPSMPCSARTALPTPVYRRAYRARPAPTRSPDPTGSTCTSASSGATSRPRP